MKIKKLSEMNKKERRTLQARLRAVIQLLYFLFLPSAYTSAFAGIKYIFTQIGSGQRVELTPFVLVLIVLCGYTIVFGRYFCGFACAFGSLGDGIRAIYLRVMKRLKKKPIVLPKQVKQYAPFVKYLILAVIAILCFLGIYGELRGTSPWDVFSMIHAGNFKLGGYVVGIVLLLLIMVGMAVEERFFCRFLCPMGAVFSLMPVLPLFGLTRDRDNCIKGCSACTRQCPSDIQLPSTGQYEVSGDCFQCQKCIGTCPKGNVHTGINRLQGNEEWFTILRAVILLIIMILLGI